MKWKKNKKGFWTLLSNSGTCVSTGLKPPLEGEEEREGEEVARIIDNIAGSNEPWNIILNFYILAESYGVPRNVLTIVLENSAKNSEGDKLEIFYKFSIFGNCFVDCGFKC